MTHQPPEGGDPTPQGRDYLEIRLTELERENAAQAARIGDLQRRIGQLQSMITTMSRAAQMVRITRLGIRRPGSLIRLPVDLVRAARSPAVVPPPPAAAAQAGVIEPDRGVRRQLAAAVRAGERVASADAPRDVSTLRVAIIADTAVQRGLAPECELIPVEPNGWQETLGARRPDLLLVQSAWRGTGGSWQYRVAWYPHPDAFRLGHLRAIVDWCRAAGIPTVFWSTGDPLHVERFAAASALFDHVLTVDPGSIARLLAEEGRSSARVAHLPPAIQPRFHNPTGRPDDASPVAFIGAAFRGRPLQQREDLDRLLDAAARVGLTIRDRQLGADRRLFGFAERHRDHIGAWLPVAGIPDAIRAHRAIIGVPDPAIVPGRVLEALACGRPVVTTSRALAAAAYPDVVLCGDTDVELDRAVATAVEAGPTVEAGIDRAVTGLMESHTYRHHLAVIARQAGFVVADPATRVALVALADDGADLDRLAATTARLAGSLREIAVGTLDDEALGGSCRERLANASGALPVRVIRQADEPAAVRHRRLAAAVDATWVHVAGASTGASAASLASLVAAIDYAGADVIGAPVAGGRPYSVSAVIDPRLALVRRTTLLDHDWPAGASADEMSSLVRDGTRLYAGARTIATGPA